MLGQKLLELSDASFEQGLAGCLLFFVGAVIFDPLLVVGLPALRHGIGIEAFVTFVVGDERIEVLGPRSFGLPQKGFGAEVGIL